MTSRLDNVLSGSIVDEGIYGKPPESPRGKRPLMPEDFMSPVRGPEDIRRDTAVAYPAPHVMRGWIRQQGRSEIGAGHFRSCLA